MFRAGLYEIRGKFSHIAIVIKDHEGLDFFTVLIENSQNFMAAIYFEIKFTLRVPQIWRFRGYSSLYAPFFESLSHFGYLPCPPRTTHDNLCSGSRNEAIQVGDALGVAVAIICSCGG